MFLFFFISFLNTEYILQQRKFYTTMSAYTCEFQIRVQYKKYTIHATS